MQKTILFFILIHFYCSHGEGLSGNTLIKTKDNFIPLAQLQKGDKIIATDLRGSVTEKEIIAIEQERIECFIQICIDDEILEIAPDTKLAIFDSWITAQELLASYGKNIKFSSLVSNAGFNISSLRLINESRIFFKITVADFHNFFATKKEILIHNFFVWLPALVWTFGEGIAMPSIFMIAGAFGIAVINEYLTKITGKMPESDVSIHEIPIQSITSSGANPSTKPQKLTDIISISPHFLIKDKKPTVNIKPEPKENNRRKKSLMKWYAKKQKD